jgi:transposase-like protein
MRTSREKWAKRVERWKDSGLTAKEFARELGLNPRSLVFWKWQLGRAATPARAKLERSKPLPLVELAVSAGSPQFEVEVRGGRRLIIPSSFDGDALRRLLAVLESSS